MTYRTRRSSGTGSLFGVLVILAVLYIPPLRDAAQGLVTDVGRRIAQSFTPDPEPPAPAVTIGG